MAERNRGQPPAQRRSNQTSSLAATAGFDPPLISEACALNMETGGCPAAISAWTLNCLFLCAPSCSARRRWLRRRFARCDAAWMVKNVARVVLAQAKSLTSRSSHFAIFLVWQSAVGASIMAYPLRQSKVARSNARASGCAAWASSIAGRQTASFRRASGWGRG